MNSADCRCAAIRAEGIRDLQYEYAVAGGELPEHIRAGFATPDPRNQHGPDCHNHWLVTDQTDFVYFIQCGFAGPIKIGWSSNPKRRLQALQTAHHTRLRMLGTKRGGESLEQEYHRHLAPYRMEGEWFAPTWHVLIFVKAVCEGVDAAARWAVREWQASVGGTRVVVEAGGEDG